MKIIVEDNKIEKNMYVFNVYMVILTMIIHICQKIEEEDYLEVVTQQLPTCLTNLNYLSRGAGKQIYETIGLH